MVVLSEAFFRKGWPQRELDVLVALEVKGRSRILPIWREVLKDEVRRFSPTLADKLAMTTAMSGVDGIVDQLVVPLGPADDELTQELPAPSDPRSLTQFRCRRAMKSRELSRDPGLPPSYAG